MSYAMSDNAYDIIDGPVYERSPEVESLLRPILPTAEEVAAEFRQRLRRAIDGVEVVHGTHGQNLVVDGEVYQRRRMFGRLRIDAPDNIGHRGFDPAAWQREAIDRVRGDAYDLVHALAVRVWDEVVTLRYMRNKEGPTSGRDAEPIALHVLEPFPCIVGDNYGSPLFFTDHTSRTLGVIYAAWYFITPVSVPPKETSCHRP